MRRSHSFITRSHRTLAVLLLFVFATQLCAATLPNAAPAAVGMSATRLANLDEVVQKSIERNELPGAVVLAARRGRVVWRKAYGNRAVLPARETMTTDTIFDLASLTKVVATATSIMILVERGKLRLSDPAFVYLPELKNEGKEKITVEQLLTHRAGFAPDFDLSQQWTGYDEAIKRLGAERLQNAPGTRFVYSDLGFITLGEIVHRASGLTLDEFARRNIYEPLGMRDTGFRPRTESKARIAPTETRRGQANYLGGRSETVATNDTERWLRGEVHDPTAFRMNGVAGHAGLFSTADDLAIYCQMILNNGEYNGVRILSPLGVAEMTRPRAVNERGDARGLGWDITSSYSSNRGDLFPRGSFGHTGFTGTSLWLDPATETFTIFLSNRVHPNGKGDVGSLRGRVAAIVAASIMDANAASAARTEAALYNERMLATLTRLQSSTNAESQSSATTDADTRTIDNANVLTGIDVLERNNFKELQGLRIALVTNHTGRNRAGKQTIDVLRAASGVRLVALFSPEHGIRGLADEKVSDSKDEQTGLPIYSLYGETRRPKPEQLKDLDAIVYDIQDVGARFYTYTSTLGNVMEEAARAHLPVFVLDRPNPIGGTEIEGPVAEADKLSFTAYHTIPVRHGMTLGELARLFNDERKINCDLRVIKMENWRRAMWYDQTNLVWVNPSPNMRSLTEATVYPGIGLLETTNLSVGRGTDTPFELIGAHWLDGQRVASYLNNRHLAGLRFVPVRFMPKASVFANQECGGVNVIVTDRTQFRPVRAGIEIALALKELYPNDWKIDAYARLLANADTLERIKRGESIEAIMSSWTNELDKFRATRARALIYK